MKPQLNRQNERLYRDVTVKTEIKEEDLLVEKDSQMPSLLCYGAVSWHGKSKLYFIEGDAYGQEELPRYKRKKKTVNQEVYTTEMCPSMFRDFQEVMGSQHWVWQQDGARAHTARELVRWLQQNTPELIEPSCWPAKSPDLNVMDYCIWSILFSNLQSKRREVESLCDLKCVLTEAWQAVSMDTVRNATSAWTRRLRKCVDARGHHFEYL